MSGRPERAHQDSLDIDLPDLDEFDTPESPISKAVKFIEPLKDKKGVFDIFQGIPDDDSLQAESETSASASRCVTSDIGFELSFNPFSYTTTSLGHTNSNNPESKSITQSEIQLPVKLEQEIDKVIYPSKSPTESKPSSSKTKVLETSSDENIIQDVIQMINEKDKKKQKVKSEVQFLYPTITKDEPIPVFSSDYSPSDMSRWCRKNDLDLENGFVMYRSSQPHFLGPQVSRKEGEWPLMDLWDLLDRVNQEKQRVQEECRDPQMMKLIKTQIDF